MPNYVPGYGPSCAKLMVVGEAPDSYADENRRPFAGPDGTILNDWLYENGVSKDEVYLTYVSKYQPPQGSINKLHEIGIDLNDQIKDLWKEIRAINPNCILALGETALQATTPNRGINKWRGSIIPSNDGLPKVVPTLRPDAFTYRGWSKERLKEGATYQYIHICKLDVGRAIRESAFRELNTPKRNLWVVKSAYDLVKYLERQIGKKRVSVDVETHKQAITCCGLAFDKYEGISIPLINHGRHIRISDITESDMLIIWKLIDQVLRDPTIEKIGQNFKFDHEKFEDIGFRIHGIIHDLMILGHTICPEYPAKSQAFWTSIYTEEPYYKDEYKEFNPKKDSIERVLLYNAKDAVIAWEIADEMFRELHEDPILEQFYYNLPQKLHRFYHEIDGNGFLLDQIIQHELSSEYGDRIQEAERRLFELVGYEFNTGSWQQVAKAAYETLGIPKRAGTDEDTFIALLANAKINDRQKEFLEGMLNIRRLKKTKSTYIDIKPDVDNKIKTWFNAVGTETGRSSTSKPDKPSRPFPQGLAFQTVTKRGENAKVRRMLTWPDDFVLIEEDYSNAEGWITALLAEDYDLIELMKAGVDAHRLTASWFFNKRCANITIEQALTMTRAGEILDMSDVNSNERYVGKKGRHGGNYGEGKRTLMIDIMTEAKKNGIDVHVSEWKCGKILDTFHRFSPNVRAVYHSSIRDIVSSTRELRNPFGRKRTFLGRPDDSMYREAFATIPQGTVPDATRFAALRAIERIGENTIIVEWHDAVHFLAPKKEWELWAKIYKEEMEKPIDFSECSLSRNYQLKIPVEIKLYERNWYEGKTVKSL